MKPADRANRLPPISDANDAYRLARVIGMLTGCAKCGRRYRNRTGCLMTEVNSVSQDWVIDWLCGSCVEGRE